MTTPAAAALKLALPHASLTYLIEEPLRRLVEGHPHLDHVLAIPVKQNFRDFWRLIRKIRREKFDAVIDFHGGPRASRITLLSGARIKVGYELKHKGFIYDIRVPRSGGDGRVHSVVNHLNLVRALGIAVEEPVLSLVLPPAQPEETEKIRQFRAKNQLKGAKLVVLHIGAGNEFRDWGEANLNSLVKMLSQVPAVRIVLVGATADQSRAQAIERDNPLSALSLVGETNLIELRELIAGAALFVGPDSGPMHIAAASSTPIVALFGPTVPANFAPWKARATLIEKSLDCRPCKQRRCVTDDFRCLMTITPEEVLAACLKYL
jgi:lipopolysaccharide heptosyltransferase II